MGAYYFCFFELVYKQCGTKIPYLKFALQKGRANFAAQPYNINCVPKKRVPHCPYLLL